jgi:UDP-N-acetylmuramyl tripeptide synthase
MITISITGGTIMRLFFDLLFGKTIVRIINMINKNRGTNLPGEYVIKFDKNFIKRFNIDTTKVIFITGTNGKSTTTNLINHILTSNNKKVISNLEGANLLGGIATSLIKSSSLDGKLDVDFFIFETDERFLPYIYQQLPAKNIVITNIQKDQVQRNGDPDYIYQILCNIMNPEMTLFLNNEEPRSKSLQNFSDSVIYYGVEKNSRSFTKDESFPTAPCPYCYHKILYSEYNTDMVGHFHCSHCGLKSETDIPYLINNINFEATSFYLNEQQFSMPYSHPFMLYNYSAAIAVCNYLGLSLQEISDCFDDFVNIGGRMEVLNYKGKEINYIRIKQENPETLQSALNSVAEDKSSKMLILGLCLLKDFVPYYTNTFYSYDCDFKPIIESNVEKYLCFSKVVCYDTANRLLYENVPSDDISIINSDDVSQILSEIDNISSNKIYLITWLKTFNDIKKYLTEEGV